MTRREKVQLALFLAILAGTLLAQGASMAHMLEAFGWANSQEMAYVLAAVTVVMAAVFTALAIITPPGASRNAILLGIALLGITEWAGNFGVGGLLVQQHMPAAIPAFFGISQGLAERCAAFLLAGFLPCLVFIAVYAITESAKKWLEEPPTNALAEHMLFEALSDGRTAIPDGTPIAMHSNGTSQHVMKGA